MADTDTGLSITGSLAAAFLASKREETGDRIPVEVVDLDRLDELLIAGETEAEAIAAAVRSLHFSPSEPSGPFLEHYARLAAGEPMMSDAEFLARWFRATLLPDDWSWLRDQISKYEGVWTTQRLEDLRHEVMAEQLARPTRPRSPSESSPSESGRGSSNDSAGDGSTG